MEELEKKKFVWLRILTGGVLAVLLVLLILAGGTLRAARTLWQYETRIDTVLTRLEDVTAELEALDTSTLVSTVNGLSQALGESELEESLRALHDVAGELQQVEWKELSENINDAAIQAQASLENAEEALTAVGEAMDTLDLEALNQAVADLKDVVEPLASFANRFR